MERVGGSKMKLKSGGCGRGIVVWGSSQVITTAAFIPMGLDSLGLNQKGFVAFGAGFPRDIPCQSAFVPIPEVVGWNWNQRPFHTDPHHVQSPERPEGRVSGNQGHFSKILGSRRSWLALQIIFQINALKSFGVQQMHWVHPT